MVAVYDALADPEIGRLLVDRDRTGAAAGYVAATGYVGGGNHVQERAIVGVTSSRQVHSRRCGSRRRSALMWAAGVADAA